MEYETAKLIVDDILSNLLGRKGIGNALEEIDTDIYDSLVRSLEATVLLRLCDFTSSLDNK